MPTQKRFLPVLLTLTILVAGFFLLPTGLQAGTIYTDLPTFLASIQPGYYLENFDTLTGPGLIPSPINFSSLGYAYSASAPNDFYATQTAGDWVLSTNSAPDPITITFTSGNVTALGGTFFPLT